MGYRQKTKSDNNLTLGSDYLCRYPADSRAFILEGDRQREDYTKGYIIFNRAWTLKPWYADPPCLAIALNILLNAQYSDSNGIKRGDIITSLDMLAKSTGFTKKQVRRALTVLSNDGFIEIKRAQSFSLISVCNYNDIQNTKNYKGHSEGTATGTVSVSESACNINEKAVDEKHKGHSKGHSEGHSEGGWHVVAKDVDRGVGGKPYKIKDDPISKTIYAYKKATGYHMDDRVWDAGNWARCMKALTSFAKHVPIDPVEMSGAMEYVKTKDFGEWTLETVLRYLPEYRKQLQPIKKSQEDIDAKVKRLMEAQAKAEAEEKAQLDALRAKRQGVPNGSN